MKLGIGPGSILEWQETDGTFTIRKAPGYSTIDVRHALFGTKATRKTRVKMKKAIASYITRKHARD